MAETGHLVFGTLHTNDAPQAIDRIIDVFPAWRQEQTRVQLAASLGAIVAQRLVPKVGGGMVAAFEVLVATNPVRNLIREGRSNQLLNVMTTNQKEGMRTLEISLAELIARAPSPTRMRSTCPLTRRSWLVRSRPFKAPEGAEPMALSWWTGSALFGRRRVTPCAPGWLVAAKLNGATFAPEDPRVSRVRRSPRRAADFSVIALNAPIGYVERIHGREACDRWPGPFSGGEDRPSTTRRRATLEGGCPRRQDDGLDAVSHVSSAAIARWRPRWRRIVNGPCTRSIPS